MKVKFDGKDLEVEPFSLYDLNELEKQGISISKMAETRIPSAKDLTVIIGYAVRKADPTIKSNEEVTKKVKITDSILTEIITAVLPGGKTQVPFSKKS